MWNEGQPDVTGEEDLQWKDPHRPVLRAARSLRSTTRSLMDGYTPMDAPLQGEGEGEEGVAKKSFAFA